MSLRLYYLKRHSYHTFMVLFAVFVLMYGTVFSVQHALIYSGTFKSKITVSRYRPTYSIVRTFVPREHLFSLDAVMKHTVPARH
jgi:hypothetical protein